MPTGKRKIRCGLGSDTASKRTETPKFCVNSNKIRNRRRVENNWFLNEKVEQLIISSETDHRPYAEVSILGTKLVGLLDSGSSVTLLGSGGENLVKRLDLTILEKNVYVSTADGAGHSVLGFVNLPFSYNNITKVVPTLVIPSIKQRLILGMDFWRAFNIKPEIQTPEVNEIGEETEMIEDSEDEPEHELSEEQKKRLKAVMMKFKIADGVILEHTHLIEHTINTEEARPVYQRPYVYSPVVEEKIRAEIIRMQKAGIIEPSESRWNNPLVAVPKSNGTTRVCLDARKLNAVTVRDDYPIPNLNRILSRLRHTKFLTSIDLKEAYHQIRLDKESSEKTSFSLGSVGKWKYVKLPFGLHNSAQCLARLMDMVIDSTMEPHVFKYLDDLIITSPDFETHCMMIEKVAEKLKAANLSINLEKSKFCRKRLNYLGYTIGEAGVEVTSHKVKAVLNLAPPTNIKEVRRVIGMANWYKRFIANYSEMMSPITDLLKGGKKKVTWTKVADEAFVKLKSALVQAPVLATVRYDLDFRLYCDARYGLWGNTDTNI
jgi:hypothetical protein